MKDQRIHVVVVASQSVELEVLSYATLLVGRSEASFHPVQIPSFAGPEDDFLVVAEIRRLAETTKIDLIISEWLGNSRAMQDLLHLAHEFKVPAVFVRAYGEMKVSRIVVATGGGPNLYEQMWLAREALIGLDVPVNILRWVPNEDCTPVSSQEGNEQIEQMCVRLLGMQVKIEQCCGPDFSIAVSKYLHPDDLLIMGAPSPLRLIEDFSGTLPDTVSKTIGNPLILLSSPPVSRINLRRLMWGCLVNPQLKADSKEEVLQSLVENLIRHNQLPMSSKADILERALAREEAFSTAVDCETAFPHVELPGFYGVAASMGICREGVDFGSEDGSPTRFFFLLVTAEGFCDEYLAIMSKISRRLIDPAIRAALLTCETSAQARDILEPRQSPIDKMHEDIP